MILGIALRELVEPEHDPVLRALDTFAAGSAMPSLVPIWSRRREGEQGWHLDPRLITAIESRGPTVVPLIETTGARYERILDGRHDGELRHLACRIGSRVARWDQEPMSKGLDADWYRHPLYVPTFGYVAEVMRREADVRLAYCTTTVIADMATFYPGDACAVVGFDAFATKDRLPTYERQIAEVARIAPGKPMWVFEAGRPVGLPRRVAWLEGLGSLPVDAVIPWDMLTPEGQDYRWGEPMRAAFRTMLGGT